MVSASDVDANDITESLRDDIDKLLNTRRGTVMIDPNYGLSDFTHLMNGYAAPEVTLIETELLQQVRQYETRLATVNLVFQESKNASVSMQFALNASFEHKGQTLNFVATVDFNDNGSISVSL